jgi:4-amino-4-deoxy-L-arabinose transferase-like glycosyltransferase
MASVLILYGLVRRWAGEIAAILGGLVLALTPRLAFTTRMLEGFLLLPALAIVHLVCARPSLGRRFLHLLAGVMALLVTGGWRVAMADFWPAASRRYIGDSINNSVLDLVFSRTAGYFSSGGGIPGGGARGLGPSFAESAGWSRIFDLELGDQDSWLVPLALLGLVAGVWVTCR